MSNVPYQFYVTLLNDLHAPATAANIQWLQNWQANEGNINQWSSSNYNDNNPFNITAAPLGNAWGEGGQQGNIKFFNNLDDAAHNTAAFLTQYGYGNIVQGLQNNNIAGANVSGELSRWSNGGYSSVSGAGSSGSNAPSSDSQGPHWSWLPPQIYDTGTGQSGEVTQWLGQGGSWFTETVFFGLLSLVFIGVGGLWFAFGTKPGQTIISTSQRASKTLAKGAEAAAV